MKKIRALFFINHIWWVVFIAGLGCLFSYFLIDIPLAKYFEHLSGPLEMASKLITDLIDPKYHYFLWPILYFSLRFLWNNPTWANRCLLILQSIPLTNLAVELVKCTLGRARPELLFSQDLYGFTYLTTANAFKSFPSGHACTIGAICGAFACFYPRATLPLVIGAFVLAFTRIVLCYHYFSDIVAGITIGILISQWIYSIMRKKNIQF